jgi:hypothetical protein
MGQIEQRHVMSEDQDITLTAGNGVQSTNVWSAATGKTEFGGSTKYADFSSLAKMRLVVNVGDTALDAAADGAVLTIAVYEHTAATSIESGNLIISKTVTVNASGGSGATAIGTELADLVLPQGEIDEKYLGVYYSVATQNISSGSVTARFTDHKEKRT